MKRQVRISMTPTVDVRRYFEYRLRRHGDSPAALELSPEGQRRRFETIVQVGDLGNCEVLDVGCGLGHLYDYIRRRFPGVRYSGLDLSPKMVAKARELYPRILFAVHDVTRGPLPKPADYVLASAILNVETGDNEASMGRMVRACFEASRTAAAVNMLSTWADYFDPRMHYYDPLRWARIARRLTRRVILRHDYFPHDFTLYLYKEPYR